MAASSMLSGRAEGEVVAGRAAYFERAHGRHRAGRRQRELLRQVVMEPVATSLGFEREHEGAVGLDVDGIRWGSI